MGFLTKVIHSWHTFYLATHRNTSKFGTYVLLSDNRIDKSKNEGD